MMFFFISFLWRIEIDRDTRFTIFLHSLQRPTFVNVKHYENENYEHWKYDELSSKILNKIVYF